MNKKRKLIEPPANSANMRARELNDIARHLKNDIEYLPVNEQEYVKGIRWTLIRYWRHEITANQASAERKLWQIRWLQN